MILEEASQWASLPPCKLTIRFSCQEREFKSTLSVLRIPLTCSELYWLRVVQAKKAVHVFMYACWFRYYSVVLSLPGVSPSIVRWCQVNCSHWAELGYKCSWGRAVPLGSWPLGLHSDAGNSGYNSLSKREDCFSHTPRSLEMSSPGLLGGPIVLSETRASSVFLFRHLHVWLSSGL